MGEYDAASFLMGPTPFLGVGPFWLRLSECGDAVLSHTVPRRPAAARGRVGGLASAHPAPGPCGPLRLVASFLMGPTSLVKGVGFFVVDQAWRGPPTGGQ